jgi:hypothetical protein
MKLENIIASLKITIGILWGWMVSLVIRGEKYLKILLGYLQTSETIFLLLFANIIGVGSRKPSLTIPGFIGYSFFRINENSRKQDR